MQTDNHKHTHHHDVEKHLKQLNDSQAICSVTGDIVDKAEAEKLDRVRNFKGQTYYFCCNTCVRLFDKTPNKYVPVNHSSDTLELTSKERLVENVWSFRFEANENIGWTPGQFIRIEIPHQKPDEEGTKRWFTIASVPSDGYIQITTRITGTTFKQALDALPIGSSIKLIEKPDGNFVWQEDAKPLVLIAGGIGITPFYSMLRGRSQNGGPVSATLIYNGRDDNLPFKDEFHDATNQHVEFTVHYVIGERLTAKKIHDFVPGIISSQVYISGPELMVESLAKDLIQIGLSGENLHQDYFPHYTDENY